jgi:UDP-N-acetylmuramate--alanine ligase
VFEDRKSTDEMWSREKLDVDLVLTRIMTLDGLEDGINFGEGFDSLARDIYIHGTNQEEYVGRACSHGCIRMLNPDVRELFARVREGDPVVIVASEGDGV